MSLLQTSVQKSISPHILSQFPEFYREHGPAFIAFVTEYFRWMETEGPLYDSRRLFDHKDIDTTVDEYLIHFKNKYLPDIQLETESNVQFLVKHSLDLYRSRGTPRAIDLLFRLVFGKGAKVYYPWKDLFRLSDGKWVRPQYIEVTPRQDLGKFVGKDVKGITSGATAFVERVVRKRTSTKLVAILYISSIEGEFQTGELINASVDPFPLAECPKMVGSLTSLNIINGGLNFSVGDVVDVVSSRGVGGEARVSNISDVSGIIDFDLVRGGYGFAANSEVIVANTTILLQNVVYGNSTSSGWHTLFEQVTQPMGIVNYEGLSGGSFADGDSVFTYYANNSVKGTGKVLLVSEANSTSGALRVSVLSGNMDSSNIHTTANAVSANVPVSNGYNDFTASGNIFTESDTATMLVNAVSANFSLGETIYSGNFRAEVSQWEVNSTPGALSTLVIVNRQGRIQTGNTITGLDTSSTANVQHISFRVGLKQTNGSFQIDSDAPVVGATSNTRSYINAISEGSGASFTISSDLLYPEVVPINNDLISDYLSVFLDDPYGFPVMPTANLATVIADALDIDAVTIGKIQSITTSNPGSDYDTAPLSRVYESRITTGMLRDYLIGFSNSSGSFQVGEVITQSATDARGLIISANDTHLEVERLKIYGSFTHSINSTTMIVGADSGATANVDSVVVHDISRPYDIDGRIDGLNAVVSSNLVGGNGQIVTVSVIDSGYGYVNGESVTLRSNTDLTATATTVLTKQGRGTGYYKKKGGFLSDSKKLFDGDYWQEFSYEVRSPINFSKYRDMLLQLLHVAGTKPFGAFYLTTESEFERESESVTVTTSL